MSDEKQPEPDEKQSEPDEKQSEPARRALKIQIDDDEMKGRYSNLVRISHTREEFILDFIFLNHLPPQASVTSRVIVSPGHVKRLVRALQDNLQRYERQFGILEDMPEPDVEQVN